MKRTEKQKKCLACYKKFPANNEECTHCGYNNLDGPACKCGSGVAKKNCCRAEQVNREQQDRFFTLIDPAWLAEEEAYRRSMKLIDAECGY